MNINGLSGHQPLIDSSDMAQRIRAFDWGETQLGDTDRWSATFKTALDLCLGSRMCSCIYWGDEHRVIYNDAYKSILGTKHPWALGRPAREVWPEIFEIIGPLLQRTSTFGETTGDDDAAIFINRSGYVEEFYCSFSYSPLINDSGEIEAVFATVPETSERVIGERRLRTLQKLGVESRGLSDPQQVLQCAARVLGENPKDIPFAGLYLWDANAEIASLFATVNMIHHEQIMPTSLRLNAPNNPLEQAMSAAIINKYAVHKLDSKEYQLPTGAWKVPPSELLLLPFEPQGEHAPRAAMIAGINPHKKLEGEHLVFFQMLGDQMERSLAEAYIHQRQMVRAIDLQERVRLAQQEERVRIARDLHDTLLQSMQGLRFLLEAGIEKARTDASNMPSLFDDALGAAVHAIDEGRTVLSLLRHEEPVFDNLATSISRAANEILHGLELKFQLNVIGEQIALVPQVWNELYNVTREAIINAVKHSRATQISLHLTYGRDMGVLIQDNGIGMDPMVARLGKPGHYGLQGMRERVSSIGGELEILNPQKTGTQVNIVVPGSMAFQKEAAN